MQLMTGAAEADWIDIALEYSARVIGTVPGGYEAYLRIFHPGVAITATSMEGTGFTAMSWGAVAQDTGATVHPAMQWTSIIGNTEGVMQLPDGRIVRPPEDRLLSVSEFAAVTRPLAASTTSGSITAAYWAGWEPLATGRTALGPETATLIRDGHTAVIQGERYLLARFPRSELVTAAQVGVSEWGKGASLTPNMLWPDDRAWFMANHHDFNFTVIGGTTELAKTIQENRELEAMLIAPDADLSLHGDHVNPSPLPPHAGTIGNHFDV